MKEYIISITGIITDSTGDIDKVHLTAIAEYDRSGEYTKIIYKEYPESLPVETDKSEYILNTVTIFSEDKISLSKCSEGSVESVLILEKDKRHLCVYYTPFGSFEMGFYTTSLAVNASENQCSITAVYTTDTNKEMTRQHRLQIKLKEKTD